MPLSACAGLIGPPVVYGTVSSGERAALPANARLEVVMVDASQEEGSGEPIANMAIDNPGAMPIRFALAYDPERIAEQRRYAVEATIRAGDRVLYRSERRVPLETGEGISRVAVPVERAPAPPPPPPVARVSPTERALATIRGSLDDMVKIGGAYKTPEVEATYEAFIDGEALVAVREARSYGDRGSARVAFYFRDGVLLAYEEEASRQAPDGAGRTNRTTLALNFAGGRYTTGRKTVNGVAGQPSEIEIRSAVTEARDARDRLIADAAMGQTSAGLGPVRFGCADGSKFLVTFSRDPVRALVTAVGHPSAVLLPQPARSGFRFTDGKTDLRGTSREVERRWEPGATPIRCTAASP